MIAAVVGSVVGNIVELVVMVVVVVVGIGPEVTEKIYKWQVTFEGSKMSYGKYMLKFFFFFFF